MQLKPHHVGISVANLDVSLAWYQKYLGFELRAQIYAEDQKLKIAFITHGDFELEVFEKTPSEPVPSVDRELGSSFEVQGYKHFAFEVEDVDATWAELTAKGLDLLVPPTSNDVLSVRYCFIRDPDGIQIEFLTKI